MSQKGNVGGNLVQVGRDYIKVIQINISSGNWVTAFIACLLPFLAVLGLIETGDRVIKASLESNLIKPSLVNTISKLGFSETALAESTSAIESASQSVDSKQQQSGAGQQQQQSVP